MLRPSDRTPGSIVHHEPNQTRDTNLIAIAETTRALPTQLIKQPLTGVA